MIGRDKFANRSREYDTTEYRLQYVEDMAKSILRQIDFNCDMHIMDFGAGTGLLTEHIAPHVGKITAVDLSPTMIKKFRGKAFPCTTALVQKDLTQDPCTQTFDGIISSATLHHIREIAPLLRHFHDIVHIGGFVALCDIDCEDGTFHTEDTGVEHLGIARGELKQMLVDAGFVDVVIEDACVIRKPQGDYPAFVAVGRKDR